MNPRKPPTELAQAIKGLKRYVWHAGIFSFCTSLLVLAPSVYMLEVYDRVLNSRSATTLLMLSLAVMLAYALMEVLEWVRAEVMHEALRRFDARLSTRTFDAVFDANLRRLPAGTPQPMNDLRTLREALASPVLFALLESPAALVYLVLVYAISPVLGWMTLAAAVLQVGVTWLNERATQPPLMAANRSAIAAQQYADGTLRNAQVIEAMGMLREIHRRWMDKQREFLGFQAQASASAGAFQALSKFLQNVVSSGLLGLGAWLLLRNELNGGASMMIVGSIIGGRVLAPLIQLVSQWQVAINARDAYARLDALLQAVPARTPGMTLPAPLGSLSVEGVMAVAPGSQVPILRGVAFALAPGEVLAVVGPSASGKTTLARLLVGLWPSAAGKVRLDGADVYAWDKAELGPHLGYLPQGVALLDGTVADNIARFAAPDRAAVEHAARVVGLHEFILALPQGYDTPLGQGGVVLSGGQRQRVALARALYGRPALVVLDEPNASLDEAGDAALIDAIARMAQQGTTFVINTHRTNVLAVADKMLVLREGQAQAFGARDDVLKALNEAAARARALASAAQPLAPAVAA